MNPDIPEIIANAQHLEQISKSLYSISQPNLLDTNDVQLNLEWEKQKPILIERTLGLLQKLEERLQLPDNEILVCKIILQPTSREVRRDNIRQLVKAACGRSAMESYVTGLIKKIELSLDGDIFEGNKFETKIYTDIIDTIPKYRLSFSPYSYTDFSIVNKSTLEKLVPPKWASNAYVFSNTYGTKEGGYNTDEETFLNFIQQQLR